VERIEHLPPAEHRAFYNAQAVTLNVTRADMIRAGYSPSVRLFDAAACGVPIVSDAWPGIETFFTPGEEILLAHSTQDGLQYLRQTDEQTRRQIGQTARERVLSAHTAANRAAELEAFVLEARVDHRLPRLQMARGRRRDPC
jgi:spore maturation protein CgeB